MFLNRHLPWWNQTLTVKPADAADAHRQLGKEHDLAATLSHVEQRQVTNDYTVRYRGKVYQIDRQDIRAGMRRAIVRVEQRLDGTIAVQCQGGYVRVRRCAPPLHELPSPKTRGAKPPSPTGNAKRPSDGMKNFSIRSGSSLRLYLFAVVTAREKGIDKFQQLGSPCRRPRLPPPLPTLPNGSCRALRVWIGASGYWLPSPLKPKSGDNHQMDERELTHWLDGLTGAGLIGEWQRDLEVEPGEPAGVQYWIDGGRYSHDGAVKLVRDFEAAGVL